LRFAGFRFESRLISGLTFSGEAAFSRSFLSVFLSVFCSIPLVGFIGDCLLLFSGTGFVILAEFLIGLGLSLASPLVLGIGFFSMTFFAADLSSSFCLSRLFLTFFSCLDLPLPSLSSFTFYDDLVSLVIT